MRNRSAESSNAHTYIHIPRLLPAVTASTYVHIYIYMDGLTWVLALPQPLEHGCVLLVCTYVPSG